MQGTTGCGRRAMLRHWRSCVMRCTLAALAHRGPPGGHRDRPQRPAFRDPLRGPQAVELPRHVLARRFQRPSIPTARRRCARRMRRRCCASASSASRRSSRSWSRRPSRARTTCSRRRATSRTAKSLPFARSMANGWPASRRRCGDLFEKRLAGQRRKGLRPDADATAAALRVLTPFDHDKQAALTHAARFLTRFTQRELAALDLRVGVLLDDGSTRDIDNPFAIPYILDALGSTSRAVYPDPRVWRPLMERLLADLTPNFNGLYIALNRLLADHGVLPEIKAALRARSEHRPADDRDLLATFTQMLHAVDQPIPANVVVPELSAPPGAAPVLNFDRSPAPRHRRAGCRRSAGAAADDPGRHSQGTGGAGRDRQARGASRRCAGDCPARNRQRRCRLSEPRSADGARHLVAAVRHAGVMAEGRPSRRDRAPGIASGRRRHGRRRHRSAEPDPAHPRGGRRADLQPCRRHLGGRDRAPVRLHLPRPVHSRVHAHAVRAAAGADRQGGAARPRVLRGQEASGAACCSTTWRTPPSARRTTTPIARVRGDRARRRSTRSARTSTST